MIINVYVNLNPSATNRSKIDSENFFLGFYYWDLLSVMLSEVVFNYNFVFFFENLHLSQHKENNRCV